MKANLAPSINVPGVPGFLLWARRDNPALYRALVAQFPEVSAFDTALRDDGLGGLMDIIGSIGGTLGNAAKSIGSFVMNNALPIATAAVPLAIAMKQADVAKAQIKLASAQMQPMQTAVDPRTGQTVPVQMVNGQWQAVPVTGGMIGAPLAQGGGMASVPKWAWIAGAGGAALLLLVLLRR
jgi:hypothetical protein